MFGLIIAKVKEINFLIMNKFFKSILVTTIIGFSIMACNSDSGNQNLLESSSTSATVENVNLSSTSVNNAAASSPSVGTVKHPPTKLGKLMNLNAPKSTFTTAASGLNPAHGMPGHTCALPVGAPLTQAASAAPQPVETAPEPVQNLRAPQPVAAQPNFNVPKNLTVNPAHGQPGHDCSIAVGAPLTNANAASEPKINPAHGQPGHDCSVAVGAPLPG